MGALLMIRIKATLPTIKKLYEQNAKIILASHLGRPKGERVESMSLAPVAPVLSERLGLPVLFLNDCIGTEVEEAINGLQGGQIVLLENLRFHKGKQKMILNLLKILLHLQMSM